MGLPVPPADRRRPSHVDLRAIQELQRTVLEQTLADARVWHNGYTLLLTGTGAVLTLAASRLGDASWKWRLALKTGTVRDWRRKPPVMPDKRPALFLFLA